MPPTTAPDSEPLDAAERRQLCDLLLDLGPDAPTLCEGWDTLDLAAHLVLRERDPRAALAIVGGSRFASLNERLMGRAQERGLPTLVDRLRSGPPLVPWRLPGLRTPLNLNEWFVHHEDVRRPNAYEPRDIGPDLDAALWAQLTRAGRLLVRRSKGLGVRIASSTQGEHQLKKGDQEVLLRGPTQELLLYLYGRQEHAHVEIDGDRAARDTLAASRLGI